MTGGIWKMLAPGRLMVKFYLWFLLALTLTVVGTGAVLAIISFGDFDERNRAHILAPARLGRDMAERLLRMESGPEDLRALLAPLAAEHGLSLMVLDPRGRRLLDLPGGGGTQDSTAGGENPPPPEEAWQALREGSWMDFHGRRGYAIALPLQLPDGQTGLLYASLVRKHWQAEGPHYRLFAGLGAVLVLGWLLCWPLAVWLARPLRQLAAAADKLGAGDLSVRIHLNRRDEIGWLAASFNTMAGNLHQLLTGHKQLLTDISHEFRSPLARLRVALELARKENQTGATQYLDVVETQAEAIDGMIEELLTFSRLDSAPFQLRRSPEPIADLLEETVGDVLPEARAKNIDVVVAAAKSLGSVAADRTLLLRALGNVLRNAVAHAPRGSAVELSALREGGRIQFTVTDSGPGVEAGMLERIFEPFVREERARSRVTGGVGLGLAIARRCMQAHGGGAEARAAGKTAGKTAGKGQEAGAGLTVVLWLPANEEG